MSWHFSQALVVAFWEARSSAGKPSAPLKSTPTAVPSSCSGRTMEYFRHFPYGMTFEPLMVARGAALLTWFLAGFHVRTSAPPAEAKASPDSEADSGVKWRESLARFDRVSRSWKTHLCLWEEGLPWSSVTLPKWGMMRDGVLLERVTLPPLTSAIESGFWPTPDTCAGGDGPSQINRDSPRLQTVVRFATPNARDWKEAKLSPAIARAHHNPDKSRQLTRQLSAMAFPGSNTTQQIAQTQEPGVLNPNWVEWLMAWPIGWTDLKPLATARFLAWRHSHGKPSPAPKP